jgi:hypothetical protein
MGENMNKEDMLILHDKIKLHPYRLEFDANCVREYVKLCRDLLDGVYYYVKDSNKDVSETDKFAIITMYHDYSNSLSYVSNLSMSGNNKGDKFKCHFFHTERCLGTIHRLLNGEHLVEYYTYYSGCNHLGLPREGRFKLNLNKTGFRRSISLEERDNSIKYLEENSLTEKYKSLYDSLKKYETT